MKNEKLQLLIFTFIVDLILIRFGVVMGTLADESLQFDSRFDLFMLLAAFLLTCFVQIRILIWKPKSR